MNASVEVNYDLGGASFVFPPQDGSNADGITSSSKRESSLYFRIIPLTDLSIFIELT